MMRGVLLGIFPTAGPRSVAVADTGTRFVCAALIDRASGEARWLWVCCVVVFAWCDGWGFVSFPDDASSSVLLCSFLASFLTTSHDGSLHNREAAATISTSKSGKEWRRVSTLVSVAEGDDGLMAGPVGFCV